MPGFSNMHKLARLLHLVELALQHWRKKREKEEMVKACILLDEMQLNYDREWQEIAIADWDTLEE